jgi:hypothetical protein
MASADDTPASQEPANLVNAYLVARSPASLVQVCASINEELGTSYNSNRLCAWRRGARAVPLPVQRLMRRAVLEYELGREDAERLAPLLEPPDRKS